MAGRVTQKTVVRAVAGLTLACASQTFAFSEPAKAPPSPTPPQAPAAEPAKPDEHGKPSRDPALSNPSTDQRAIDQPTRRGDVPPVEPSTSAPAQRQVPAVAPPRPVVNTPAPIVPISATPYPEGSVVVSTTGTLLRASDGDIIFVPEMPAEGSKRPVDPAMVLLPSQRLGQVRASMSAMSPGQRVTMSGQVFVYHGRNYLLPTTFAMGSRTSDILERNPSINNPSEAAAHGDTHGAENASKDIADASTSRDPRVADLLKSLESDRGGSRSLEPSREIVKPASERAHDPVSSGGRTTAGGDGANQAPVTEGTLYSLRRGRLVRSEHDMGKYVFSFDNDPNSRAPAAMPILPCRLLELMEQTAALRGEDLIFRLSGRVTVFDGRNYLMPITFQVGRSSDVTPLQ